MYRAMFDEHVKREQMNAVFQEYAWDMGWCDPCAADPLSADELRGLGVFWVGDRSRRRAPAPLRAPQWRTPERVRDAPARALRPRPLPGGPGVPGDGRPHELPGPLRDAAAVDGTGHVPAGRGISPRAARAAGTRGADAGVADRVVAGRRPASGGVSTATDTNPGRRRGGGRSGSRRIGLRSPVFGLRSSVPEVRNCINGRAATAELETVALETVETPHRMVQFRWTGARASCRQRARPSTHVHACSAGRRMKTCLPRLERSSFAGRSNWASTSP